MTYKPRTRICQVCKTVYLGGVRVTHCPQGHEYTPENSIEVPRYNTRRCRTCHREIQRRYVARRAGRVA